MERMVTSRLNWFLETNNILTKAQTGFRKGKSTIDQIIKLQDTVNKYNRNKGFTVGVFLDFEKSYDMIWRAGLLAKLKQIGINGQMFSFVNSFIHNRSMQVQVGGTRSKVVTLENGSPQGSVISPVLFLVMINDLKVNSDKGVELSLFADDSATYKSGPNLDHILKTLQTAVDLIAEWCDKWGFKISVTKSCGVIFTNRTKVKPKIKLKINDVELKMETKVRFLGIIFDSKLSWSDHINYIVTKCTRRLNLMRSLTGTNFGASKHCLLTIYRVLIRSLLEYGSIAFDSAPPSIKHKLDTIQYKALCICCGAMKGTPLSALQVDCGELPLGLRRLKQQLKYAVLIQGTDNHPSEMVIRDHWANVYGHYTVGREPMAIKIKEFFDTHKCTIEPTIVSKTAPWARGKIDTDVTLTKRITKNDPPPLIKSQALEMQSKYTDRLAIYTDGSKVEGGRVASAFVIPELGVSQGVRISDNLTVFTSELIAIKLCLKWITENSTLLHNRNIVIYSDSLSSIISLENNSSSTRSNLVGEILKMFNYIQNKCVTLAWIPSHVNIRGNECADILAKSSILNNKIDCEVTMEQAEMHELIDKFIIKKWQEQWSKSQTGRQYKLVEPNVSCKIKLECLNRNKENKLTRMRLGHCRLNKQLYNIGGHRSGLCEECGVDETLEHYLLKCTSSNIKQIVQAVCKKENVPLVLCSILKSTKVLDVIYKQVLRDL